LSRTTLAAALLATALVTPALAQNGPPPSPYTPRVDKPACTMDELKATASAYVEGQKTGSLAALPLHEKAQYLQDMTTIPAADGLWNTALTVDHAMSFHDPVRCKTFSEIVVTGPTPYVIGSRLYLDQGKVIRVDSLVTTTGHWLFNANAYLKYAQAENWEPLMKYQGTPAAEMIRGANAYLDAFSDKFTDIPWGQPCARLEGGAYTNREGREDASCEVGRRPLAARCGTNLDWRSTCPATKQRPSANSRRPFDWRLRPGPMSLRPGHTTGSA
jgi:hypothetical protein